METFTDFPSPFGRGQRVRGGGGALPPPPSPLRLGAFPRPPLSLGERAKGEGRCSLIPIPSPGGRRERAERAARDPLHFGRGGVGRLEAEHIYSAWRAAGIS